ncbi:MAG: hypothetical protein K1Y01_20230 [Vicinamibacteria bacterium]|nr:hypothetical protein [Vicinamibacteria bacterium]
MLVAFGVVGTLAVLALDGHFAVARPELECEIVRRIAASSTLDGTPISSVWEIKVAQGRVEKFTFQGSPPLHAGDRVKVRYVEARLSGEKGVTSYYIIQRHPVP